MRQNRTDIRITLLHMEFDRLSEMRGHDQRPDMLGFHNDSAEVGWVDRRGQITHPPIEVTAGNGGITKSFVVHRF